MASTAVHASPLASSLLTDHRTPSPHLPLSTPCTGLTPGLLPGHIQHGHEAALAGRRVAAYAKMAADLPAHGVRLGGVITQGLKQQGVCVCWRGGGADQVPRHQGGNGCVWVKT